MTLGAPVWLNLLWLLPLLAALMLWAARRRRKDLQRLISAGLLARYLPAGLEQRRAWRATLVVVGLGFVALAAAQPRWGYTWRELDVEGVEIIVALDLSRSMDAQDITPSRLDRARREVGDLLGQLRGDKVGLVIFAAGAYPRVPLTVDYNALMGILDNTDTDVLQAQGSSIASALRASLDLFGDEAGVDRAVVLISDGEAWDDDLGEAADALAEAGVSLRHWRRLGRRRADPGSGGGFKTDRGGEVVISRLDEEALKRIAARTGGAYVRSVAGGADVRELVAELRSVMERTTTESRRERVWDERFQYPLAAGLGLLVIAAALSDAGRGLVLFLVLGVGVARAADPAELLEKARAEDPAEAVEALTRAQAEDPGDPWAQWALAEALHRAGRYDDAAEAWEALAERAPDPQMREQALYNAGHSRYQAGRLDEAVQAWEQVLAQDPEHQPSQQNAEAVRKEIAQRVAEQQQQQDPSDGPQDGAQQPQEGEGQPQEGQQQPQEGQQGAQGEESEPEEGGQPEASQQPQAGDGTRDEAEERPPADDTGAAQSTVSEADDTGGPEQEGQASEPAPGVESMSPDEAQRLLDGVEEGRPRVVAGGRSQEKDW
ncbi:MAG: VWA domain-containing protein [Alphaproteobacteria bacterium]|nr:VWA domain-containing protein [Alphaproteobacteria bacterium]